ncbi:MAG: hypothetical protein ACN4GW_06335 [Desulforhopalus sp.]
MPKFQKLYVFRMKRSLSCLTVFCLLHLLLPGIGFSEYEKPMTLKASSILTAEVRKGKHHEVEEQVRNDGILNHYRINSPFGIFDAGSTAALHIMVHEIEAIAAMKEVETDDTAVESLKNSGKNTAAGLKKLFTDPQETIEGAASGVSGLFNRAKGTVGKRETTAGEDSKTSQLIGLSKSKGLIANKFGVNMYSANPVLQEELDRLALADYLGGLGMGAATSFVPGLGGFVLSTSNTARLLNESINTTPASQLWLDNKNKLLAMKMNEDTVELFLNNPAFTPAQTTVLVTALDAMKGVANRELYIKIALGAGDLQMARAITSTAVLMAGYHKNIAPLAKLTPFARLAKAEKNDGSIVLVLPADHIIWSKKVGDVARSVAQSSQKEGGGKRQNLELWVLGDFSKIAQENLESMGWELHTNASKKLMPGKD